MLKPETIQVLKENGYDSIKEYLHDLADEYDVPYSVVVSLYQLLGEQELFDGLVSAVQDAEGMDRFCLWLFEKILYHRVFEHQRGNREV